MAFVMSPCSKNCDDGCCVWHETFQNYAIRRLQYIRYNSINPYFWVSNKQALEKHSWSGKRDNNTSLFLFTYISQGITPTSAGIFCFIFPLRLQQPLLQLPWPLLLLPLLILPLLFLLNSLPSKKFAFIRHDLNGQIKTHRTNNSKKIKTIFTKGVGVGKNNQTKILWIVVDLTCLTWIDLL